MRGPSLIAGYLDALAGQLPGAVVEELAGGLEETYRRYLGLGLPRGGGAAPGRVRRPGPDRGGVRPRAPGPPRRSPGAGGRAGDGGVLGGGAGHRPRVDLAGPVAARIVPGVILVAVVALLAVAARGIRYRPVGRAGTAGCVGIAALDGFMIIGVLAADPAARWAVAVAMAASAVRLGLSVRLLRPVLANG